jgi:hypothetical protein
MLNNSTTLNDTLPEVPDFDLLNPDHWTDVSQDILDQAVDQGHQVINQVAHHGDEMM